MRAAGKAVLLGALFYAYAAPEDVLERVKALLPPPNLDVAADAAEQGSKTSTHALRTLLTLAVTTMSLLGPMSPGLIAVSCMHAALHFLLSYRITTSVAELLVFAPAGLEYALLASFLLLLRYVWFPPTSTLASFQRHRTNLARFFARHDKKYVPYVDRLLEDHVGHERLLYARIRRLYRWRTATADSELSS